MKGKQGRRKGGSENKMERREDRRVKIRWRGEKAEEVAEEENEERREAEKGRAEGEEMQERNYTARQFSKHLFFSFHAAHTLSLSGKAPRKVIATTTYN